MPEHSEKVVLEQKLLQPVRSAQKIMVAFELKNFFFFKVFSRARLTALGGDDAIAGVTFPMLSLSSMARISCISFIPCSSLRERKKIIQKSTSPLDSPITIDNNATYSMSELMQKKLIISLVFSSYWIKPRDRRKIKRPVLVLSR